MKLELTCTTDYVVYHHEADDEYEMDGKVFCVAKIRSKKYKIKQHSLRQCGFNEWTKQVNES